MMSRQFIFILLFLVLVAGLAGAQTRIITAGSSSSEIVCALALCERIVGTDRTSLFPEKLQSLPSIGYRSGINAEGILSLRPDLVILESTYVNPDVITQIQSTGIKVIVVDPGQNFESTRIRIRAIGVAVGKEKEADQLIKTIEQDLKKVESKVSPTSLHPRVLCVYGRGTGSLMVAGKNTSFGLLAVAGALNAVPEIDGYKPLNAESLIQANPDYVLFFTTGLEAIGGINGALTIPGMDQTIAGKKRQIIHMDGILLTNWGPRVASAAGQLFDLTHPQTK